MMRFRASPPTSSFFTRPLLTVLVGGALHFSVAYAAPAGTFPNLPISDGQRQTAQQVAQAGVALSDLAPNAPDTYTVKRGDTLWDISQLFLRHPWRWPELWGMNMTEIHNPHLIYPGQMLYLEKANGRATLRVGKPVSGDTIKLSPRARSTAFDDGAISGIPLHWVEAFLNEAIILNADELAAAPRIVAAPDSRVLMSRGDLAYVRGDLKPQQTEWRIFRQAKPLKDPASGDILGYEAAFVGTADLTRAGSATQVGSASKADIVPSTFTITSNRQEAGVGDRLTPVPPRDFTAYAPHSPSKPVTGRIASIYGDAVNAGQNQIVSINMGQQDGMEPGHVLAVWQDGGTVIDQTDPSKATLRLPDERHGLIYVFRVFKRMSYALILNVQRPVKVGDRFTQP
jgi:nucleoid-associated protein YgaU